VASSHTLVGHFREAVQQDIVQLLHHSATLLRVLEATKDDKSSVSPDRYVGTLATELSVPIENAARLLQALENLQQLIQETGSIERTYSLISRRLDDEPRKQWEIHRPRYPNYWN
jgi:hypothetical protein